MHIVYWEKKLLEIFVGIILLKFFLENSLSWLNYRYIRRQDIGKKVSAELGLSDQDLQQSLDYAEAKFKFGQVNGWLSLALLLVVLAFGWLGWLENVLISEFGLTPGSYVLSLVFFGVFFLFQSIWNLPASVYQTFVLEERFGFNKTTPKIFVIDTLKGLLLSAVLGAAVLYVLVWILQAMPDYWWFLFTVFFAAVSMIGLWAYPRFIAPLFNKFTPVEDEKLREDIESLCQKIGFSLSGLFVMNASLRSSHGNAYFTGVGKSKRIVLFDTLLDAIDRKEVIAVLAHELGHFKLKHVAMMMVQGFLLTGLIFFLIQSLVTVPSLQQAWGFETVPSLNAMIFLIFFFWGYFSFFITPLQTYLSRRNEFAADAFSVEKTGLAAELASALLKLREKSKGVPFAHPLFSFVYYSHPPIVERIKVLKS